jgi:hypothetical protein
MHIEAQRPAVTITPYARPDGRGYFTPNRVWIEDGEGSVIEERSDPRASFAGHVRATQWDQLQRLYFSSYALWNYLTTPFLFAQPGFEVSEIEPHQENGEIWRRLHVKFPSDVPTHCAEQTFFFSGTGLLQRVDYVTDIYGELESRPKLGIPACFVRNAGESRDPNGNFGWHTATLRPSLVSHGPHRGVGSRAARNLRRRG